MGFAKTAVESSAEASCMNSKDSHCLGQEGSCLGLGCEFLEPKGSVADYREIFWLDRPVVQGSRLHPDFDFVGNRFGVMHENNRLYYTENLNQGFH